MMKPVFALCTFDDGSMAALTASEFFQWEYRIVSFRFIGGEELS